MPDQPAKTTEGMLRLPDDAVPGVLEPLEGVGGKTGDANVDLAKVLLEWFGIRTAPDLGAALPDEELTERCAPGETLRI
jgi:hypothetical protein